MCMMILVCVKNINNSTREWKDLFKCQMKSGVYSDTPFLVVTVALLQSIIPIVIGQQWSLFNRQANRASATNEDNNFNSTETCRHENSWRNMYILLKKYQLTVRSFSNVLKNFGQYVIPYLKKQIISEDCPTLICCCNISNSIPHFTHWILIYPKFEEFRQQFLKFEDFDDNINFLWTRTVQGKESVLLIISFHHLSREWPFRP
ncbi:hypothetical protein H8356DRAFT_1337674 [Neocallimastix lanati (nom. inval.)]|nr:hypothetical protein H8356DRAFT_1337674 [Neocallimastix sp. JGI-2020a]